jgi:quercetin dioxygenase-like cupin family protein
MMENKSNEATPQRPEGDRMLNAPLVEMDLNKFIEQIKEESTWADSDRNSITIFKSHSMRIVLMGMHKDAELKTHTANGIISVQVLEGRISFNAGQATVHMEKGHMIALQEMVPHSVVAVEDSFFLLTLAMNK